MISEHLSSWSREGERKNFLPHLKINLDYSKFGTRLEISVRSGFMVPKKKKKIPLYSTPSPSHLISFRFNLIFQWQETCLKLAHLLKLGFLSHLTRSIYVCVITWTNQFLLFLLQIPFPLKYISLKIPETSVYIKKKIKVSIVIPTHKYLKGYRKYFMCQQVFMSLPMCYFGVLIKYLEKSDFLLKLNYKLHT